VHGKDRIVAMTGYSNWFGLLAGVLAIIAGVYSLLRTSSVEGWLASRGLQHSLPTAVFLRQVEALGILFILAGDFLFSWRLEIIKK
jgi:hypothetical protein